MRLTWPRVFYGWWVVAGGAIIGGLNAGLYYYGFGAFFTPIIAEFGWSRAALAGAFSVARVEGGIVAPAVGFFIDRFGPRRVMLAGISVFGLGYVLISRVDNNLVLFYLIFILALSIGTSFGTSLPPMAAVNNWFIRRRGMAAGLLMAGYGIGGGVGAILLGWLITAHGWRTTAIIAAIIIWAIGLPAASIIRHRPERYGLLPDGDRSPRRATDDKATSMIGAVLPKEATFTPRQALACSSFWYISAAIAIRQMVSSAVAVHEAPFLIDRGYGLEQATALLAFTVWVSVLGRLFWGWLGDHWDRRWALALCHVLMASALVIMTTIPDAQSPTQVGAFIVVYGLGYGGTIPVSIAMIAEYFGRNSYATIQGLSDSVAMLGTLFGPFFAGYVFDVSRSYVVAMLCFAAIVVVGLPVFPLIRRPASQAITARIAPSLSGPPGGS